MRKTTKKKPRKRQTRRLKTAVELARDHAESLMLASQQLFVDAITGTPPLQSDLDDWMRSVNRFLYSLCAPLSIDHVISFHPKCVNPECGSCGRCTVLSFTETDERMQQYMHAATEAIKGQPSAAINTAAPGGTN